MTAPALACESRTASADASPHAICQTLAMREDAIAVHALLPAKSDTSARPDDGPAQSELRWNVLTIW